MRTIIILLWIKKTNIWALTASYKGVSTEGSLVVYLLQPVTLTSSALQKQLKKRLNSMLGTRTELIPMNGLPNYLPGPVQQVARADIVSVSAAQPNAGNVSNIYSQGGGYNDAHTSWAK